VAGERILICVGDDLLPRGSWPGCSAQAAPRPSPEPEPEPERERERERERTSNGNGNGNGSQAPEPQAAHHAVYSGGGALVVDTPDLGALADAAESLARRRAAPAELGVLLGELNERGVGVWVLDARPDSDGAVARWIVDPVARNVARWAAGRQLAPAALLGISLGLAVLAATWFSEPAVRPRCWPSWRCSYRSRRPGPPSS